MRTNEGRFQSLIGKLKTENGLAVVQTTIPEFQSLIGKLKTKNIWQLSPAGISFQSLIGKLKTEIGGNKVYEERARFNPL